MPESRAAAATAAKKAAKAAAKPYTTAARIKRAQALADRRDLARACAQAAYENGVGAKAALKSDQFAGKGLTYNMVQPLLAELKAADTKKRRVDAPRDHHRQILTNDERLTLAHWILACADGQLPKNRVQISAKVREMLLARHASNKRRGWGGGSIKLNGPELAVVRNKDARLAKRPRHCSSSARSCRRSSTRHST